MPGRAFFRTLLAFSVTVFVVVIVVVVVLALTHRHNVVCGHRTITNNSGPEWNAHMASEEGKKEIKNEK